MCRNEHAANVALQANATRIGRTFHIPAPIRAKREAPAGFFARLFALIF